MKHPLKILLIICFTLSSFAMQETDLKSHETRTFKGMHWISDNPMNDVLFKAIDAHDIGGVARALNDGANIDIEIYYLTPLHLGVLVGDDAIVRLLINRGADPRIRNDINETAADLARNIEQHALARFLEGVVQAKNRIENFQISASSQSSNTGACLGNNRRVKKVLRFI